MKSPYLDLVKICHKNKPFVRHHPKKFNLLGYNLVFYTNIILFNFMTNLVDGMRLAIPVVTVSLNQT